MAKFSVKKDDYVMIIAGKDKGKTAQVLAVNKDNHRVLIEGKGLVTVNKKAVKARKASDKGGIIEQPGSVDISNVMPVCSACNTPTRVGYAEQDGKKVRICKKCGAVLVTKKPAQKKTRAKKADADAAATTEAAPKAKAAVRKKAKPAATEE
ncbi:MAG TPA: 50S ribosomal protein L24 [Candidatus Stercoripulliclostridium merdipullorum]|uniref:Large ribosomal subunit protein uL24 n=1 Tax=Candidatus Stercoripulliclostridium merdipullorum TaxID=2840952 RepID=A0A9D1NAY5_9FIRM|nr:50S ribosomal protein L24 [Candidatus Stercoripulliclostridium merdipullorum]